MLKRFKNKQYYKFCLYGFFKNLQLFEPFLMLYFIEQGISFVQIGSLYAIREITVVIIEIPTGIFADIIGRKKTMLASFIGYITSFIIFFISTSYILLVVAILFFSFGTAMRTGTHKAIIFDYLKIKGWENEKLNYYGHTRSWSQVGSALSALLAVFVVLYFKSYKYIFIFSTLPYLADLFLVWTYPKYLDKPIRKTKKNKSYSNFNTFIKAFNTSIKSKQLWYIFANLSVYQGYFKALKDYLQPLILFLFTGIYSIISSETIIDSSLIIGLIYFLIFIISSITSRNANILVSKMRSKKQALNTTLYLGIIAGISAGIILHTSTNYIAILLFVLLFVFQNIRKPLGASLVAELVKNETLATGLSIQSQVDSLFTAVFALTIGLLAEYLPLAQAISIFGFLLLTFSTIIALITKNKAAT